MKIVVNQPGAIEIYEDDWNEGEGDFINEWSFNIEGTYRSAEELIERIQNVTGMFLDHRPEDFIIETPGRLWTDEIVNFDNEKASRDEIERWKRGEIELYKADMYLEVYVVSDIREIEFSDADEFGFGVV